MKSRRIHLIAIAVCLAVSGAAFALVLTQRDKLAGLRRQSSSVSAQLRAADSKSAQMKQAYDALSSKYQTLQSSMAALEGSSK